MERKPQAIDESRRRLFGNALRLGAAGAGLSVFGVTAARSLDAADEPAATRAAGEYHETDHIRQYYRTTW